MTVQATLLLALALGAPALKDPPKKGPTVVGEWEVESISTGGRQSNVGTGLRYTFTADGKWLIHRDGEELAPQLRRGFVLDARADPPAVDLVSNTAANNSARFQGIFKVEGDTLTLCGTRQKGADRPTKFEAPDGSQVTIYVLRRARPKE
jgi:uncharacterized protein (TIGR03067 family)